MDLKQYVFDLSWEDLKKLILDLGEPPYRVKQAWQGIYIQLWESIDKFSVFPRLLRTEIHDRIEFSHLTKEVELRSSDGETVKYLFSLPDGNAIETVLMTYNQRSTLCVSTQAGCAMGCVFCATGQMGLTRNLSSGEIIEQVIFFARMMRESGKKLTNIVFMGMGEPFHNYEATMQAIDRLNNSDGFAFGERRFTISTVGLIPKIREFTSEKRQVNLAISLHSTDDNQRSLLLPINKRYPIKEVMDACLDYVKLTHRRVTFEWALIHEVNDSQAEAENLGKLLQVFRMNNSVLCHVNVIPLNPTRKYTGHPSTNQQAQSFSRILTEQYGIPCSIRIRRGIDIQAGCGQLSTEYS